MEGTTFFEYQYAEGRRHLVVDEVLTAEQHFSTIISGTRNWK